MAAYQQLADTDTASDNVKEIVAAAFNGRVDRLVFSRRYANVGQLQPGTGEVVYYQDGQRKEDYLPSWILPRCRPCKMAEPFLPFHKTKCQPNQPLLLFSATNFGSLIET
ncbi:MAG: hypothetical protein M5U34_35930 [Chloroflexi bacterium]|nr:hypothetical protein [Chloroflexota bacterium]